jgi:beta-lactamase regulating signal transducer with metallopeptidase domain
VLFGITDQISVPLVRLLVDVCIQSALLLAVVAVLVRLLRRLSASVRSQMLVYTVVGLLLLPVLSTVGGSWHIPLLSSVADESNVVLSDLQGRPAATGGESAARPAPSADPAGQPGRSGLNVSFPQIFLLVWIAGVVVVLIGYAIGFVGLWWVQRGAIRLDDEMWRQLLAESRETMGCKRRIELYASARTVVAFNRGLWRARIILPADAIDWPERRKRMVLLHELAHVKRMDGISNLMSHVVNVFYWFNPLVWLSSRHLQVERERACDDAVLSADVTPSDYAEELMNVASEIGSNHSPVWNRVATAEGSSLKDRILCILDPNLARRPATGTASAIIGLVFLAIVVPISAGTIWEEPAFDVASVPDKEIMKLPARTDFSATPKTVEKPAVKGSHDPAHTGDKKEQRPKEKPADADAGGGEELCTDGKNAKRLKDIMWDLDSPDRQVRITAAIALRDLHSPAAIPALVKCLDDSYEEVRISAVITLGDLDVPESVEGLRRALNDPVQRIRIAAVNSLSRLTCAERIDALRAATRNDDWNVRDYARGVLRDIDSGRH